jgi:ABC-type cobalamin transport system permease subunit
MTDPAVDPAMPAQPVAQLHAALPFATIGAGALLLSISDYFWPPDAEAVPAWAWVAGGLGVVVVGTGIAISAATAECVGADVMPQAGMAGVAEGEAVQPTPCLQYTTDPSGIFGPMVALHGLPLIAIPISYAIRAGLRAPGTQVSLESPAGGGFMLKLRGTF